MITFLIIVACLCIINLFLCIYMLDRNQKVYDFWNFIIWNRPAELYYELKEKGITYDKIMYKFWVPVSEKHWIPQDLKEKYNI